MVLEWDATRGGGLEHLTERLSIKPASIREDDYVHSNTVQGQSLGSLLLPPLLSTFASQEAHVLTFALSNPPISAYRLSVPENMTNSSTNLQLRFCQRWAVVLEVQDRDPVVGARGGGLLLRQCALSSHSCIICNSDLFVITMINREVRRTASGFQLPTRTCAGSDTRATVRFFSQSHKHDHEAESYSALSLQASQWEST